MNRRAALLGEEAEAVALALDELLAAMRCVETYRDDGRWLERERIARARLREACAALLAKQPSGGRQRPKP